MKILSLDSVTNNELNHNLIADAKRKLLQLLLVSVIGPSKSSMMPLAPSSTDFPSAHKPKIGFSIDSIVGDTASCPKTNSTTTKSNISTQKRSHRASSTDSDHIEQNPATPSPEPSFTDISDKTTTTLLLASKGAREIINPFTNLQPNRHEFLKTDNNAITNNENAGPQRPIPFPSHRYHPFPQGSNNSSTNNSPGIGITSPTNISTTTGNHNGNINSIISSSKNIISNYYHRDSGVNTNSVTSSSPSSPPVNANDSANNSRSSSPQGSDCRSKSPLPHSLRVPSQPLPQSHPPSLPPHLPPVGPHGIPQFAAYPPGMFNFAAAAAAAAAHQHHPGLPGWMPSGPHPPHHPAAAHPLYPWLLAKHSRMFPHRFGPGPDLPGFLLQPFRKPKRIRTAFSPSQLLKLEHAFEKNHYVVGAERKQLANSLSLSETQVKVWFQNRRTKHKRTQQDEEMMKKSGGGSGAANGNGLSGSNFSSSAISADSSTRNYNSVDLMGMSEEEDDDEEEIIMDDDCSDQEEGTLEHLHQPIAKTT